VGRDRDRGEQGGHREGRRKEHGAGPPGSEERQERHERQERREEREERHERQERRKERGGDRGRS
jgi:hypothetical protein